MGDQIGKPVGRPTQHKGSGGAGSRGNSQILLARVLGCIRAPARFRATLRAFQGSDSARVGPGLLLLGREIKICKWGKGVAGLTSGFG